MSIQLFVNWKLHDKIDRPLHPDKSKERHVGYRAQLSAPRAAISYALKLLSQHEPISPCITLLSSDTLSSWNSIRVDEYSTRNAVSCRVNIATTSPNMIWQWRTEGLELEQIVRVILRRFFSHQRCDSSLNWGQPFNHYLAIGPCFTLPW